MPTESPAPARTPVVWLGLLMLVALAIRFLPVRQVIQPDGVRFYDSDSYYHMRRVWMCLDHFPRVPIRDPFENHPMGGVTMWPPLHDTAIAAVILLLGGAHPSVRLVEVVGAIAPAVLGALAVLPLYVLGLRLLGRREALMAAALMVVQPAHVLYSAVGRPDQHVTEILLSSVLFAAVLGFASLREDPAPSRWEVWWPRIAAALAATAAVLVWMGSLLFVVVVGGFGGLVLVGRTRSSAPPIEPLARDLTSFFALHAVTLAIGTAYLLHGMEVENTYVSFSWFQAHFSALVAVAFALAALPVVAIRSGMRAAMGAVGKPLAASLVLGALLVPTRLGGTLDTTLNAIHHVNKSTHEVASNDASHHLLSYNAVWLRSIQEYAPLLFPKGHFDPRWALDYVGPILFLVPLTLPWLLARGGSPSRERRMLVLVWTAAAVGMALSQVKYVYLAAPLSALFVADLLGQIHRWLDPEERGANVATLAMAAAAAALLFPGLAYLAQFNSGYDDLPEPERTAMIALGRFSPDPGSFTADDARPAYGVMTYWDMGNYTEYLSRRPVVANNNGYGFDDSLTFYLAPTEDDAVRVLERRNARYAIFTDLTADLATVHEAQTGSLAPYFTADPSRHLHPLEPFLGLVYARLFFADGASLSATAAPPLERFRLVFEAPGPAAFLQGHVAAPVKIFELVAGARLEGHELAPGKQVVLSTSVTSNLGRTWVDRRTTRVKSDGGFSLRVPYGAAENLPVKPTAWSLEIEGREARSLSIPEAAVQAGATITLDPAS